MTSQSIPFKLYFIVLHLSLVLQNGSYPHLSPQTLFPALLFALVSQVHPSYHLLFSTAMIFDRNRPTRYEALRSARSSSRLSFLPLKPRYLPQYPLPENHQTMFFI